MEPVSALLLAFTVVSLVAKGIGKMTESRKGVHKAVIAFERKARKVEKLADQTRDMLLHLSSTHNDMSHPFIKQYGMLRASWEGIRKKLVKGRRDGQKCDDPTQKAKAVILALAQLAEPTQDKSGARFGRLGEVVTFHIMRKPQRAVKVWLEVQLLSLVSIQKGLDRLHADVVRAATGSVSHYTAYDAARSIATISSKISALPQMVQGSANSFWNRTLSEVSKGILSQDLHKELFVKHDPIIATACQVSTFAKLEDGLKTREEAVDVVFLDHLPRLLDEVKDMALRVRKFLQGELAGVSLADMTKELAEFYTRFENAVKEYGHADDIAKDWLDTTRILIMNAQKAALPPHLWKPISKLYDEKDVPCRGEHAGDIDAIGKLLNMAKQATKARRYARTKVDAFIDELPTPISRDDLNVFIRKSVVFLDVRDAAGLDAKVHTDALHNLHARKKDTRDYTPSRAGRGREQQPAARSHQCRSATQDLSDSDAESDSGEDDAEYTEDEADEDEDAEDQHEGAEEATEDEDTNTDEDPEGQGEREVDIDASVSVSA